MHLNAFNMCKASEARSADRGGYGGPFKAFFGSGYFFSAKLSATRCSAMEATGETAPLGPALGSGGLGLG